MIVGIRQHFEAAHYLPYHHGKCKNLHGHTWVVEVEFEGEATKIGGMVLDFAILKEGVSQTLDKFDHTVLNDTLPNPTAENIALYLNHTLMDIFNKAIKVKQVVVYESPNSWARIVNP